MNVVSHMLRAYLLDQTNGIAQKVYDEYDEMETGSGEGYRADQTMPTDNHQ